MGSDGADEPVTDAALERAARVQTILRQQLDLANELLTEASAELRRETAVHAEEVTRLRRRLRRLERERARLDVIARSRLGRLANRYLIIVEAALPRGSSRRRSFDRLMHPSHPGRQARQRPARDALFDRQ
jgi:cell division protein FtsB